MADFVKGGPARISAVATAVPEFVLRQSDVVARAAATREPHHIAYYARELSGLWNPYIQDGDRHRVLSDDASLTSARLGLAQAVKIVLANSLALQLRRVATNMAIITFGM